MAEWEEAVLFCSVFLSLSLGGRRVYGRTGFKCRVAPAWTKGSGFEPKDESLLLHLFSLKTIPSDGRSSSRNQLDMPLLVGLKRRLTDWGRCGVYAASRLGLSFWRDICLYGFRRLLEAKVLSDLAGLAVTGDVTRISIQYARRNPIHQHINT